MNYEALRATRALESLKVEKPALAAPARHKRSAVSRPSVFYCVLHLKPGSEGAHGGDAAAVGREGRLQSGLSSDSFMAKQKNKSYPAKKKVGQAS